MANQSFINNHVWFLTSTHPKPPTKQTTPDSPQGTARIQLSRVPGRAVVTEELATEFRPRHGATWRAGRRATDWAKVDG